MSNIHVIAVSPNGEIYDPHFAEYDMIKRARGIALDAPPKYDILTGEKRRYMFVDIFKNFKERMNHSKRTLGCDEEDIAAYYRVCPQFGSCITNAWAYKMLHKDWRIEICRFGWERKDGTTFWEFGEDDKDGHVNQVMRYGAVKPKGLNEDELIREFGEKGMTPNVKLSLQSIGKEAVVEEYLREKGMTPNVKLIALVCRLVASGKTSLEAVVEEYLNRPRKRKRK